jgi:hypothetical protein
MSKTNFPRKLLFIGSGMCLFSVFAPFIWGTIERFRLGAEGLRQLGRASHAIAFVGMGLGLLTAGVGVTMIMLAMVVYFVHWVKSRRRIKEF